MVFSKRSFSSFTAVSLNARITLDSSCWAAAVRLAEKYRQPKNAPTRTRTMAATANTSFFRVIAVSVKRSKVVVISSRAFSSERVSLARVNAVNLPAFIKTPKSKLELLLFTRRDVDPESGYGFLKELRAEMKKARSLR